MNKKQLIGSNKFVEKDSIAIIETVTAQKANETVSEILQKYSDFKTALFLSGGSTPKNLYKLIAKEKKLKAGAIGLVDERFGKKNHRHSNELMIRGTGIIEYFENQNLRFYPIIDNKNIEISTKEYDEALRFIFEYFPKSVGVMGIGEDGHTAGLPASQRGEPAGTKSLKLKVKSSGLEITRRIMEDQSSLVSYYELEGYGPRITMSFAALTHLDLILILVLGQEKRGALKLMFSSGKIEEVPARYYKKPEIAKKTILITDQII